MMSSGSSFWWANRWLFSTLATSSRTAQAASTGTSQVEVLSMVVPIGCGILSAILTDTIPTPYLTSMACRMSGWRQPLTSIVSQ